MKKRLQNYLYCMLILVLTGTSDAFSQVVVNLEDFESGTMPPGLWTADGSITRWTNVTTGTFPTTTPYSGTFMGRFGSRNANSGTIQAIVSPAFDLSAITVADTARVSFWIYRDDGAPTSADLISIFVNTTNTIASATQIGSVARERTLSLPDTQATNGWYQYTFNIPASFNGSTNYLFIRGAAGLGGGNGGNIYIDDFQWDSYPTSCSGMPVAGTISSDDSILCDGFGITDLHLTGQTNEVGIDIQWFYGDSLNGPWFNLGSNVTTISTNFIASTTYFYALVTCTNSGLADSTAVLTIVVDPTPAPQLTVTASNNANYCAGVPVQLTVTGGDFYSWSGAGLDTTEGDTVYATVAGGPGTIITYTVIGTNLVGCDATTTIDVTAHSTNTVTIQATPNDTICAGQTLTLNANITGGAMVTQINWSTGETTQSIAPVVSADSTFMVDIMNNWGCVNADTLTIHVAAGIPPVINSLTGSAQYYCAGGTPVTLAVSGSGYVSATWSPATGLDTTAGDTVHSAVPQGVGGQVLYTVTLTDSTGCASSDTIRVIRSNPQVGIQIAGNDSICPGETITLNAQVFPGTYSYLWSPTNDTTG